MKVAEQIARLMLIKRDIRSAVNTKGIALTEDEPFSVYPSKVMQIRDVGGDALPSPMFFPMPGRYQGFVSVRLEAEVGDVFIFAEGRNDPVGALRYTDSIGIDVSRTITAIAYDRETGALSRAVTAQYDITGWLYDDILDTGMELEEDVVIIFRQEDIILRIEDTLPTGINDLQDAASAAKE